MAIDFRVRPPFRGFRAAFHPRADPGSTDDELMESFIARLDKGSITKAVVVGRFVPDEAPAMRASIPNDDIVKLIESYPGRFEGVGSVDVRDREAALAEIDRIKDLGLKGVAFDNPLSVPARHNDDEFLYPLYDRLQEHGLLALLTSSGMIGPDISYSNPVDIQRVGLAFPELTIVVPHASWPWTTQIAAVLFHSRLTKATKIYVLPDFYMNPPHTPGRQDYIDLAHWGLADRVLFASSYPAQDPAEAAADFDGIAFEPDELRQQILSGNAERLLDLVPSSRNASA